MTELQKEVAKISVASHIRSRQKLNRYWRENHLEINNPLTLRNIKKTIVTQPQVGQCAVHETATQDMLMLLNPHEAGKFKHT